MVKPALTQQEIHEAFDRLGRAVTETTRVFTFGAILGRIYADDIPSAGQILRRMQPAELARLVDTCRDLGELAQVELERRRAGA